MPHPILTTLISPAHGASAVAILVIMAKGQVGLHLGHHLGTLLTVVWVAKLAPLSPAAHIAQKVPADVVLIHCPSSPSSTSTSATATAPLILNVAIHSLNHFILVPERCKKVRMMELLPLPISFFLGA